MDNRTVGRVWSFRDITERKRAEEKLEAAKTAAEKASKAKDDFLALLSHELRTPLTPALAAASYLAEHEDLLPEFREEVTAIWSNVHLEARLIDNLLDLTQRLPTSEYCGRSSWCVCKSRVRPSGLGCRRQSR